MRTCSSGAPQVSDRFTPAAASMRSSSRSASCCSWRYGAVREVSAICATLTLVVE